MLVTYAPEGGDSLKWTFEPDKVRASKAEMIEKRYGAGNYTAWKAGVMTGDVRARRVLLWHLMSLEHPTLRFEDVPDFAYGEVKVEQTYGELVAMRDRVAKADGMDAETREQILSALEIEIGEAREREAVTEENEADALEGKAS